MSFSSFKSTPRKPNSSTPKTGPVKRTRNPQNPTHKVGPRRSRSVSALSRTHSDIISDFTNTLVNPLFWADGSDSSDQFEPVLSNFDGFSGLKGSGNGGEGRRGRSVSRNSGGDGGGGEGTVGAVRWRRRSPSQCGNDESDRKQENVPSKFRNSSKISLNRKQSLLDGKNTLARSASDLSEILQGSLTWSSQHPALETSDDSAVSLIPHFGDGTPMRPVSDVEERTIKPVTKERKIQHFDDGTPMRPVSDVEETIKPVTKERKVIPWEDDNDAGGGILETFHSEVRRAMSDIHNDLKDALLQSESDVKTDIMCSNVAPELANPDAEELVRDFREEFTRELEECEERTRKLRSELAIEEHRELELSKIISDMIPEPATPQAEKPRFVRKGSTERRKMVKSLEEEAMAYFDECVSISTFDDSDFSSLEDPPSPKAKAGETSDVTGVPNHNSSAWSLESQDVIHQRSRINSNEASDVSTSGISIDLCRSVLNSLGQRPQFSFTSELPDSTSQDQGIRNYLKRFSKDKEQETNVHILKVAPRKSEIYDFERPVVEFLLNKMSSRSRIESGGMLLCDGGAGIPRLLFSSNFW